jgi:hypothetical protein
LSLDLALQPGSQRAASPTPSADDRWARRIGAQGTLETGLAHATLAGAAVFVDLRLTERGGSVRFSLRGAYGEREAAAALNLRLLASRAEACWGWALADVALGPCGGVDVGVVFADSSDDGGRRDEGVWGSAAAHGRASWQFGRLFAVEAQLGLLVPFVRYRFSALSGGEVTDSASLGFETALGLSFRI